jgi:hypothetical protein
MDSLMNGGCNQTSGSINITPILMGSHGIVLIDTLYNPVAVSGLSATNYTTQTNVFCQTATGLENQEHEVFLSPSVYPNPFESEFSISNLPAGSLVKISIYDALGRMVQEAMVISHEDGILNMNAGGYPAGWYHLRLSLADGKFFNLKLLKQ